VNDSYNNINQSSVYFTVDTLPPIITLESPLNQSYVQSNVDFNITVDEPLTNALFSVDGGVNHTMANDSVTHYYNVSYPALPEGSHNVTFWVNDSFGHENSTTAYFTVDITPPILFVTSPANITYPNNTIWFNLTLNEAGSVVLVEVGGVNHTLTNSSGNWWYSNDTLSDGSYVASFYANDSAGNVNATAVYFSIDTTPPTITNSSIDKPLVLVDETINVSATVTDTRLDSVWVNITWPTGISDSRSMSNSSSLYFYEFNETNQTGSYVLIVFANDTLGNEANSSLSFEVANATNVSSLATNGTTSISVTIRVFYNGTSRVRNQTTDSSFEFILPSGLWDITINTSQLDVTLFNTNLTQNITRSIRLDEDAQVSYVTTNVLAIKSVALKFENFSFSVANLTFSFNSSLVSNPSALKVYKCSNWDFTGSSCSVSWVEDSSDSTFNASIGSDRVMINASTLSAFSLGETQSTTTTTIPATTTVSTGGGMESNATTTTTITTTTTTTTTVVTTTLATTTTTPVTVATTPEEETKPVRTHHFLVLIPAFAVVAFVIWFVFFRKKEEKVMTFEDLKRKWAKKF
jgi:hypothetical protein